jgi:hydrogenase large subunit
MGTFKIAPVSRLEGHLDVTVTTSGETNGIVTTAENEVVMFRGMENIMVRRDPRDAPIIAPRT